MEPKVEIRRHWILRFWRTMDDTIYYASAQQWGAKRNWWKTQSRTDATKFLRKSDARGGVKRKAFERLLEGEKLWHTGHAGEQVYEVMPGATYFWEVVEVTETITTTTVEEVSVSNAPAMVQIARAVS